MNIPTVSKLKILECDDCPWLNAPENNDYKYNIKKLTKLQKISRKFILRKGIKNYLQSEAFAAWYYKPDMMGGKKVRKDIEAFISSM